jgi:hypothetical protein
MTVYSRDSFSFSYWLWLSRDKRQVQASLNAMIHLSSVVVRTRRKAKNYVEVSGESSKQLRCQGMRSDARATFPSLWSRFFTSGPL